MKIFFTIKITIFYLFVVTQVVAAQTSYFDKGKELYENKKYDKSRIFFERDIVFNPLSEKSYLFLAKIFISFSFNPIFTSPLIIAIVAGIEPLILTDSIDAKATSKFIG